MKHINLIVPVLLGTLFCFILALFLSKFALPAPGRLSLYFILAGFTGSFSLALFRIKRYRDVVYFNLFVILIFVATTKMRGQITLILLLYQIALVLSLLIYQKYIAEKISHVPFTMLLIVPFITGLFSLFASIIHHLAFMQFTFKGLFINTQMGSLIGLGIALGSYFADFKKQSRE